MAQRLDPEPYVTSIDRKTTESQKEWVFAVAVGLRFCQIPAPIRWLPIMASWWRFSIKKNALSEGN